jgi:hypothetical protein
MWTKETAFGGQVGLPIVNNQESLYSSTSPLYHEFEPVILNGILYYNMYHSSSINVGIAAVDIRTGETLWIKNTTETLAFGQVLKFRNNEEFGSQAFLWTITGNTYNIYDPFSGGYIASVINVPSSLMGIFGSSPAGLLDWDESNLQGSVLFYWVSGDGNLTMWNSSLCLSVAGFGGPTPYKVSGNFNFSLGIQWSVPLPTASPAFSIAETTNEAILVTSTPLTINTFIPSFGESYALDAAYNPKTGQLLWGPVNQSLTRFNELDVVCSGEGYYVRHDKDTNKVYGYSLTSGAQLWGPVQLTGNAFSTHD